MERLDKFVELEKEHVNRLVREHDREGVTWRFPNGYGASVAVNEITHFVPELAVLKYDEIGDSDLCYETHITPDVIPNVSVDDVQKALKEIKALS